MNRFIYNLIYPLFLFAGISISLPPFFKTLSLILLLLALVFNKCCNKNSVFLPQILKVKNPILWLVIFYFLYCVGMLYTADFSEGFKDLSIKLPFLLLPIIACLTPKRSITKGRLWNMFLAFALGLFIMQIYSLGMALGNAFSGDAFNIKEILYTRLARKIHSTYFSLYTCIAFLMFYLIPLKYLAKSPKKAFVLKFIAMLWLSVFNVLLSSRIGIIAMLLICLAVLFNEVILRKKYLKSFYYLLISFVFVASFFVVKNYNNRYANIVSKTQVNEKVETKIVDSVSQRSFIYGNIDEMIMKNPFFGVGTGDVKNELQNFYSEKGVDFGMYLNAHNQFLQIIIAIGVLGLICFLTILFFLSYPLCFRNGLILLFSVGIVCVFMMTESVLERQQGVHFVSFYFVWLSNFLKIRKEM